VEWQQECVNNFAAAVESMTSQPSSPADADAQLQLMLMKSATGVTLELALAKNVLSDPSVARNKWIYEYCNSKREEDSEDTIERLQSADNSWRFSLGAIKRHFDDLDGSTSKVFPASMTPAQALQVFTIKTADIDRHARVLSGLHNKYHSSYERKAAASRHGRNAATACRIASVGVINTTHTPQDI
jgi:hypothetical protein